MADQGYQLDDSGLPVLASSPPQSGYTLDDDGLPVASTAAQAQPQASPAAAAPAQSDWWGDYWGPLKDHASQAFYNSTNGQPASMPQTDPVTARSLVDGRATLQQDIAAGSLQEADADTKAKGATAADRLAKIDHVLGIMGGGSGDISPDAQPADVLDALTHDKLMASERYRTVYASALPVLGPEKAQAYAKDTVSKDAHFIPYLRDGIFADLIGAPSRTAFDEHYGAPGDNNASGYLTRDISPEGLALSGGDSPEAQRIGQIGEANIESGVSKIAEIPWLAGGALGMGADKFMSLFGGDTTAAEDFFFKHAEPLTTIAQEAQSGKPQPTGVTEKTVDKVTQMIPALALAAATRNPEALEATGADLFTVPAWRAAWDAAATAVRNNLLTGETMAAPGAVEAARASAEKGGTPGQAAAAAVGELEQGTAQNVMPIAAGGTILRKALTGGASQAALGEAGRLAAGAPTDSSDVVSEFLIGAGMGQLHQELPPATRPKIADALETVGDDATQQARIAYVAEHAPEKGSMWASAELHNIVTNGQARDEAGFQAWNDARAAQAVTDTPEAETATPEAAATTQAAEALVGHPQEATDAARSKLPTEIPVGESGERPPVVPAVSDANADAAGGGTGTVATSAGDVTINRAHDVPLLGGSNGKGVVYLDKDFDPKKTIGGKQVDVTPYLAEHEAVEAKLEGEGQSYTDAHAAATAAEHARVEADGHRAEDYEAALHPDIRAAGTKEATSPPPDMIEKPYEHPHNERQRQMLAEVDHPPDGEPVKTLQTPIGTVHVETAAGQERSGTNEDGSTWSRPMRHDYGYLEGVPGRDGGSMDVLVGEGAASPMRPVFVIDQKSAAGGFDEHKVLVGFQNQRDAERAYLSEYPKGWDRMGAVHQMSAADFKTWARTTGREEAQLGKVPAEVPRVALRGQQPDAVAMRATEAPASAPPDRLSLPNASPAMRARSEFTATGEGEAGHAVLRNLYDVHADPRGLFDRARENLEQRGLPLDEPHMHNEFERLVISHGFDGYAADGRATVLGAKPNAIRNPVAHPEQPAVADVGRIAAPRAEPARPDGNGNADRAGQDTQRAGEAQGDQGAAEGQADGGQGVRVPAEPPWEAAHQGVEPGKGEGEDTSIRNAATEAARATRGAEPVEKIKGKSTDEIEADARVKLAENPGAGRELAAEVATKPRNISDVEAATLAIDRQRIVAEHADAMNRVAAAIDAKDEVGEAQARAAMQLAEDARERNEIATTHAGTEWSNSGRARMLAAQKDESLVSLLTEAKIRAGRDVTPAERSVIEKQAAEIADLRSKIEAGQTGKKRVPKMVEAAAKSKFDKAVEEYHKIPANELMTKECAL